jgi:ABC-2 type transport system ATP-binding protein
MSEHSAIEASELMKTYDGIIAVDHVSFDVNEGEVFGFLGPNGAGKTTTIRMLTGLSKPTAGSARVLGFDVGSNAAEAKKYVGVVPELSNLYDELSAVDNLRFMAQLYGVSRSQRKDRADQLLKSFRLYDRKDQRFGTFSRGMKRALTIAAALVHNPRLLFLDEPTVGLDVVTARSLRLLIRDLSKQGITIFLTTHYLEEADLLCDRIAILVKGKVVKIDSPEALKGCVREGLPMEVTFSEASQKSAEELSQELGGVEIALVNGTFRIYGGTPAEVLQAVLHFAKDKGIRIEAVTTVKPSLEDAFIKITGLAPTILAVEKGGRK